MACGCSPENRLETALKLAGDNRQEMEKVLDHYRDEPEKLAAAEFLISNMPAHYSYADADSIEKYYDVALEVMAMDVNPDLHRDSLLAYRQNVMPDLEKHTVPDIRVARAQFLIDNIDRAFTDWKTRPWASHLNFEEFCEWLLPYKIAEFQSMDSWRDTLSTHFGDGVRNQIRDDEEYNTAFRVLDLARNEILTKLGMHGCYTDAGYPLLSARVLHRQTYGRCIDYVNLGALTFRSLGVPVVVDEVPFWGRYRAGHSWYTLLGDRGQELPAEWDLGSVPGRDFYPYQRIPKVFRKTFEADARMLEYRSRAKHIFPFPICRKDVSEKYMRTVDVDVELLPDAKPGDRYCYIAVFNGHEEDWSVIDFGTVKRGKAHFTNMGRNVLYMVMGYDGHRPFQLSDPFILENDGSVRYVRHDPARLRSVDISRKYWESANVVAMRRRLIGGRIQGADRADFSDAETVFEVTDPYLPAVNRTGALHAHRYWRWLGADGTFGSLAELELRDADSLLLEGRHIGCADASAEAVERAFDGNLLSNFESAEESGAWVGIGLEKPAVAAFARIVPRSDDNDICPGDEYEFKWWNGSVWISSGRFVAESGTLHFDGIPAGAMMWITDHTRGWDERPFFIHDDGTVEWR